MTPTLSICIPTHHGRAAELETALASVIDPLTPDQAARVEVCVSDNGARDDTAAVVERAREREVVPVRYHRFDRDVGVLRNVLAVVDAARGTWAWPFSSDDALAPEAIGLVLAALDAHPGTTGLSVDRVNMDRGLARMVDQDPPECAPTEAGVHVWRSANDILRRLGPGFRYISAHVVRCDEWRRAVADHPPAEVTELFPQTYVMARMVQRAPVWVWIGRKLVLNRTHNHSVGEVIGPGEDRLHAALSADVERCWAALLHRRSALYREILDRELELIASAEILRAIKRLTRSPWRTDVRLLASLVRTYWRQRRFWVEQLPVLLTPSVVVQRRAASATAALSPPIAPDLSRARLTATPPQRMRQRHQVVVACHVENLSPATLVSGPPNPVYVSYRWATRDTGELVADGLRAAFDRPLAPGGSATVPVRVVAPWDTGPVTLRLSLVQEFVGWWDDLDAGHGQAAIVEITE
jgi:hypothetical protein